MIDCIKEAEEEKYRRENDMMPTREKWEGVKWGQVTPRPGICWTFFTTDPPETTHLICNTNSNGCNYAVPSKIQTCRASKIYIFSFVRYLLSVCSLMSLRQLANGVDAVLILLCVSWPYSHTTLQHLSTFELWISDLLIWLESKQTNGQFSDHCVELQIPAATPRSFFVCF